MRKMIINNPNHWFCFMDNKDYIFILLFKNAGIVNKASKDKFGIVSRHSYVLSRLNK